MIHLTPQARTELREDAAPVFDRHRVAICCAYAGETDLPPDFGLRTVFGRTEQTPGGEP